MVLAAGTELAASANKHSSIQKVLLQGHLPKNCIFKIELISPLLLMTMISEYYFIMIYLFDFINVSLPDIVEGVVSLEQHKEPHWQALIYVSITL